MLPCCVDPKMYEKLLTIVSCIVATRIREQIPPTFQLLTAFKKVFQDVICLDATRVQLTLDVPPLGDYIHANWVKFDGHDRSYIVAQVT